MIPCIWKSAFVFPLLKGGDPAVLNNYCPISKLSILAKVLEQLISHQLREFLHNNILCVSQSGFRSSHSTTTAALKVINDFIESLDNNIVQPSSLISPKPLTQWITYTSNID